MNRAFTPCGKREATPSSPSPVRGEHLLDGKSCAAAELSSQLQEAGAPLRSTLPLRNGDGWKRGFLLQSRGRVWGKTVNPEPRPRSSCAAEGKKASPFPGRRLVCRRHASSRKTDGARGGGGDSLLAIKANFLLMSCFSLSCGHQQTANCDLEQKGSPFGVPASLTDCWSSFVLQ